MDDSVLTKIIEHYGVPCPIFKYENRLLDKNVADLVAKGFMKLLNKQKSRNSKQRLSLLENIRKSCKVEPPGHLNIDDNVTELIRNAYEKLPDIHNINKELDSFLIRNLKEMDIKSIHAPSLKPDIIQALINLNGYKQEINDVFMKDTIYWNVDDSKENSYWDILKTMWNVECINNFSTQFDDVSLKVKPLIEKIFLPSAFEMLSTEIIDEEDWYAENEDLQKLFVMSSVSSECFQICCSIMNTMFIKTNFDVKMQKFITQFIDNVKSKVEYISQLYQSNLQHIVVLLDIELDNLEGEIKKMYITSTLQHLSRLHKECKSDLIMLLSHFNMWFDLYYQIQISNN